MRGSGRLSIQETYESNGDSFGSGSRNAHGLHLRSFRINVPENGKRVNNGARSIADALRGTCAFSALESSLVLDRRFAGFSGIACGGIVGAAMETQGNWNAVWHQSLATITVSPSAGVDCACTQMLDILTLPNSFLSWSLTIYVCMRTPTPLWVVFAVAAAAAAPCSSCHFRNAIVALHPHRLCA